MMNQSEDNKFNKQWEDAFRDENASPPPSIWQALEEQLDASSAKKAPIVWWKTPRMYYMASAACLLIAFVIGGDMLYRNNEQKVEVASEVNVQENQSIPSVGQETGSTLASSFTVESSSDKVTSDFEKTEKPTVAYAGSIASASYAETKTQTHDEEMVEMLPESSVLSARLNEEVIASNNEDGQKASSMLPIEIAALSTPQYQQKQARFNKRIVFYRPSIEIEEEIIEETTTQKEYYAGATMMPALFNPNVSVASSNPASASINVMSSRKREADIPSRNGTSIAIQTYGGIKLNKRWSIETGVSYLKGNSVFESNGYMMDVMNVQSINALETALASGSNKVAHKLPSYNSMVVQNDVVKPSSTYYVDVKEGYENNYSFLQLPLQAGYTIAPDKKMSYTILGGMVGNLFLQNSLRLSTGGTLRTTASDRSYQPLHWSASSGLRINYQFSEKWSTMLTGSYQKALLETGANTNGVELKPQLFGVGWGIKVNF
jgi:hypothetical protein